MKKTLISLALAAAFATARVRTTDVAFTYRMGAGFAGDVNRTHPASIFPALLNGTNPIAAYGFPGLANAADGTVRGFIAADQGTTVSAAGVLVRPYPVQQSSGGMSQTLGGSAAPAANQPQDFLDAGFILVKVPAGSAPQRGATVYVWCTASSGAHVQGGFEIAASAGNTAVLKNAAFVGGADANGIAEVRVWQQS